MRKYTLGEIKHAQNFWKQQEADLLQGMSEIGLQQQGSREVNDDPEGVTSGMTRADVGSRQRSAEVHPMDQAQGEPIPTQTPEVSCRS